MKAAVMLQGTASNVGKSVLVAAFCRIFKEDGLSVAPFKAQNMALNSFVTNEGHEMGRAQATQAYACKILPTVHMNPVLLKPTSECGCQVIVMGKPIGHMEVLHYYEHKKKLKEVIHSSLSYLSDSYDVVVVEGAGSPAEINLKAHDITNMYVAVKYGIPVILVGDIDRGGVYAHFVGTLELLDPVEQECVKGFIINKFRGNASLLSSANTYLESKTNKKLYGVVPMIQNLGLPEEDSVSFWERSRNSKPDLQKPINIAIVAVSHISNFTDFDAFEIEADVHCFFSRSAELLETADVIILPGSKNTCVDIIDLQHSGFLSILTKAHQRGSMIIGICGGYQMLGTRIQDPSGVESSIREIEGFGLLDVETVFESEKTLFQTQAVCTLTNSSISGYEIHHGLSHSTYGQFLVSHDGRSLGTANADYSIWGTYMHGIFDNDDFRTAILNLIRKKKGLCLREPHLYSIEHSLHTLAQMVRTHVDMNAVYRMMGL